MIFSQGYYFLPIVNCLDSKPKLSVSSSSWKKRHRGWKRGRGKKIEGGGERERRQKVKFPLTLQNRSQNRSKTNRLGTVIFKRRMIVRLLNG